MGKKSAPPKPPDYTALAKQQAELDKAAAAEQTAANRPNQNTPWGSTSWQQGPNGTWTENVSLNPADQALLDQDRAFMGQQQQIGSGLLGRASETLGQPVNMEGLPEITGYDTSKLGELPDAGFGAVEQVRDAWMGRAAPDLARRRESEIQRLKNQGLTEDSEPFQRAMERLDRGDVDASNEALKYATDEYGAIYDRSMRGRGQQFAEQGDQAQLSGQLRQQMLAEREGLRQSPLNDYMKLVQGIDVGMPEMPSFMGGAGYNAADVAGAGQQQFDANLARYNAKQAKSGGLTKGLFGLAGAAMGGPVGGALASWIPKGG